jgi:hypothetical protein
MTSHQSARCPQLRVLVSRDPVYFTVDVLLRVAGELAGQDQSVWWRGDGLTATRESRGGKEIYNGWREAIPEQQFIVSIKWNLLQTRCVTVGVAPVADISGHVTTPRIVFAL